MARPLLTRHRMRARLGLLFLPLISGCTGFSLGENDPDGNLGTHLGGGAIAVDPRTENAFVLLDEADADGAVVGRNLFAISADGTHTEQIRDLSGREDPRMLFVESGILVMSQAHEKEELLLLDRDDFSEKQRVSVNTWYWGTRLSASKRWVGVANNDDPHYPIHLIDSRDLGRRAIPHGGDNLEAMFANASDRLFAIVFYADEHKARILSWDMDVLEATSFLAPSSGGVWAGADLDITVDDVISDASFSYTWVGVSPDDAHVVFPVRKWTGRSSYESAPEEDYELLVVDTASRDLRVVPNAKGPVGFTPDGSTIVSYGRDDSSGDQKLLLVDSGTLEVDEQEVPIDGGLSYFVSREGNFVVVASSWGNQSLVLYDVSSRRETKMAGTGLGLDEFVSRIGQNELWAVDWSSLYRIDMSQALVEEIELPFAVNHVGIQPSRDRLLLGDADPSKLHFFDPTTREVERTVNLAP